MARQTAKGVSSSYDALIDMFESLGNFLKRLDIYANLPPTPMMTDIIVKILVELLAVLALATKQIKQGRFSECAVNIQYVFRNSISLREVHEEAVWRERDRGRASAARSTDPG